MDKDIKEALIIELTLVAITFGAYLIIKTLKTGAITDITRDSQGRIISIIEKPLK